MSLPLVSWTTNVSRAQSDTYGGMVVDVPSPPGQSCRRIGSRQDCRGIDGIFPTKQAYRI